MKKMELNYVKQVLMKKLEIYYVIILIIILKILYLVLEEEKIEMLEC